jgi:hypothetical protein
VKKEDKKDEKKETKKEDKKDDKKADAKKDAKKDDKKADAKKDAKKDDKKADAKKGDKKKEDDKPHPYRAHAWTDDQHDVSHEKEFDAETKKPTIDLKALGAALSQGKKQHPGETKSTIAPYFTGEHSWSVDQLNHSNEKEWKAETEKPTLSLH